MLQTQIVSIINIAANVFYVLLLVRIIFSWFSLKRSGPIVRKIQGMAHATTEPLLRPIRNLLFRHQRGVPIDFSPLVAWIIVEFARRLIVRIIFMI